MTAPVPPRCVCSHSRWRHVAERFRCTARSCDCTGYEPAGPTARQRRAAFISRRDVADAWRSATTVVGGIATGLAVLALIHAAKPLGELLLAAATNGALR